MFNIEIRFLNSNNSKVNLRFQFNKRSNCPCCMFAVVFVLIYEVFLDPKLILYIYM